MVAPVTPSNSSTLAKRLQQTFPQLRFAVGDNFYWSASEQTVFFRSVISDDEAALLLHETAHGLLGHHDFTSDIALLKCERDAWRHAKKVLAPQFGVDIDEDTAQDHLDTYRNWLHARSLCPSCHQTGLQAAEQRYECINCKSRWRVNEARTCGLRRYALKS